jgi:hypothetical protein
MARDVNNAIVIAFGYETSAQTGSGNFKPGEAADIIAHHLATADFGGGYQVAVSQEKNVAHVSVSDPTSHISAEITIHSNSWTDVVVSYKGNDTHYGGSYPVAKSADLQ